MHELIPGSVPGIVKAAVILTFFNTWVLFEETVVDRYGLWEYMPYYRVARLCAWDIGALALILWFTLRMLRRARTRSVGSAGA
jgi:hypothetical protein